jgi:tetratricopeptide (TPR) repeat protein
MALCERELGNTAAAFHYFAIGIDSVVAQKVFGFTGLYDYLHLGVTKIRSKDYAGAIAVLEKENRKYDKFAETYYYLGIACLAMGRKTDAISHLLQARALLNDGSGKYYLHDIYCEMPDAIYLSNVEEALARARD